FRYIDQSTRQYNYLYRENASEIADSIIQELNHRFRENGVGFKYEGGHIVRIDSEFIHEEVVKPALLLLHDRRFAGAQAEFLNAHKHYRHDRPKETLAECLKAFESVMKVICDTRGWNYDPKSSTSSALLQACFDNGLIPAFWQQHFT